MPDEIRVCLAIKRVGLWSILTQEQSRIWVLMEIVQSEG
jgi:hypothetical protein